MYGLAAGSGERSSMRRLLSFLTAGMRISCERFSGDQVTYFGAFFSPRRLYEAATGFKNAVISTVCSSTPAIKLSVTSSPLSALTETFMCSPFPLSCIKGLGEKSANSPFLRAIV